MAGEGGNINMEFGLHEYTLEQRIEEVKLCVSREMWQAALALALTIPDICGQIEFTNLKMKNKKGEEVDASQGRKYSEWFRKYVEFYFADVQGWDNNGFVINPYFTGDMCYQLRCAFLHSGDDATNKVNDKIKYRFSLRTNSCNGFHQNENREINHADIYIANLCNYICEGALRFYNEWDSKRDFSDKKCKWLDTKEWNEGIESINRKI